MYVLGEYKEIVMYVDLEVDLFYNLYKNIGYGLGLLDSLSEELIKVVLNLILSDYLYFVVDIFIGKVYFLKIYEEY